MIHFWAKTASDGTPGISAYDHMVNVGCVARCLAEMSPNLLERFDLDMKTIGALAALHDLGKISPGFQRKCEAWLVENDLSRIDLNGCWDTAMESDHGRVSHAAIQDFLMTQNSSCDSAPWLAAVLGAHHGRIKYFPNPRGIRPPLIKQITESRSGCDWDRARQQCAQQLWGYFCTGDALPSLTEESAAIWWLAGLTTVADWIGSDERFFSPVHGTAAEDVFARAREALQAIGFLPPVLDKGLSFEDLFGFFPNDMQRKALDTICGPGVYVIEAPMGTGKTEAALGAAYRLMASGNASGIFFALPTQATSNRIHLRMNEFIRRIAPNTPGGRLIHGNSWLMQSDLGIRTTASDTQSAGHDDARVSRDWFASAKRALIAPFGVGTVDQALLGVVAAKHFFVRHFALAGKVVILDEVHSYDLYTGTLIDKLITTLEALACTVIVLSATLSGKRRDKITPSPGGSSNDDKLSYPLITGRREGSPLQPVPAAPPESHPVKIDFIDPETAVREAIEVARNGGAVLWICDTIAAAQNQYRYLTDLIRNEFPIGLLHSRFPHWRREQLEDEWMERFGKSGKTRCGSILVSTQIVEQSVDLDADLLITELAPADMLLQRLGRLWRHERGKRPIPGPHLCILKEAKTLKEFRSMEPEEIVEAFGGKAHVYDPYVLLRTLQLWKDRPQIVIPKQIRELIEGTYCDRDDEPKSWDKLFKDRFVRNSNERFKAAMSSNYWQPQLPDAEGIQTRLNEVPTVSVILCHSIDKYEAAFLDKTAGELGGETFRFATAQAIHRNLVKVPEYCFESVVPEPNFINYVYGSQCLGIVSKGGEVIAKGLKSDTRLSYFDAFGLVIEKLS
ncbi:MAG: CRISPR-associated helicase Cas3' [Deltaproteobacteria bacterium]|nr:CRISPR-associated helicase Cas3' [Deltaproteobacteria bacterium]